MKHSVLSVALAIPWLLGACAPDEVSQQPHVRFIMERGIPEEPLERLSGRLVARSHAVFRWRFASQNERAAWEPTNVAALEPTHDGAMLRPASDDPQLRRLVTLQTDSVHAVEAILAGDQRGHVDLFWASAGQPFSESRRLRVLAEQGREILGRGRVYRFELRSHPLWRGVVTELRFDPTSLGSDKVELIELRGLRHEMDAEQTGSLFERSWRVALEGDLRSAWIARPGCSRVWSPALPRDAELRFSFGIPAAQPVATTFRVSVGPDDQRETLFESTIGRSASEAGVWHEARVPLEGFEGERVELRFEALTKEPLDLLRGVPAWANPMVLGTGEVPRRSVIVILLDTLRADRLSAYGHARRTSPHIDAWAEGSAVLFRNAVAAAPWTLPAHASLFTGFDALRHGVNHSESLSPAMTTLAEILRSHGYVTAAITGGGYLRPEYGFAQGFDRFRHWTKLDSEPELAAGLEVARSWLREYTDVPVFLFFHTYETHFPYRTRQPHYDRMLEGRPDASIGIRRDPTTAEEFVERGDYFVVEGEDHIVLRKGLDDQTLEVVRGQYDSAVAYADSHVGVLLGQLSRREWDESLIILTSDHGEALGEDGRAGHSFLDDYNLLIPLIVQFPQDLGAGEVVDTQVSTVDILPTILDVVGIDPPENLDGRSMVALARGEDGAFEEEAWSYASSSNRGLSLRVGNRLKLIYNNAAWSGLWGPNELYDLERDPNERHNLAPQDPRALELAERVEQRLAASSQGWLVEIRNDSQGRLEGSLAAEGLNQAKVKSIGTSCRCLRFETPNSCLFELGPGEGTTLVLEGDLGPKLTVAASVRLGGSPDAFEARIPLDRLARGWVLRFDGEGWLEDEGMRANLAIGLSIRRAGAAPASSAEVESEVEEQLRALGYVP